MRNVFLVAGVCLAACLNATPSPFGIHYPAQFDQDKWIIEEVFNFKKEGYFVDIGALDGEYYSNTLILERYLHWKGICIEPNPLQYKSLINNRRNSINLNVCLDYTNHEVDFRFDNNLFAGIVDSDTDNNPLRRPEEINTAFQTGGVIRMMTKTLEQVLDEAKAPRVIDVLSIDVEGAETRILKDFPFEKYTFLCLVIERPSPELNRVLQERGYVFVKNGPCDSFYVHPSISNFDRIEKQTFSQIPCNL